MTGERERENDLVAKLEVERARVRDLEARAASRWQEVQAACARAENAYRERDLLAVQVRDLEVALREAIEVIEWCGLNDKTRTYEYGEARPNGDVPRKGATFNTPREFASWWPDKLRAVLAGETAGEPENPYREFYEAHMAFAVARGYSVSEPEAFAAALARLDAAYAVLSGVSPDRDAAMSEQGER